MPWRKDFCSFPCLPLDSRSRSPFGAGGASHLTIFTTVPDHTGACKCPPFLTAYCSFGACSVPGPALVQGEVPGVQTSRLRHHHTHQMTTPSGPVLRKRQVPGTSRVYSEKIWPAWEGFMEELKGRKMLSRPQSVKRGRGSSMCKGTVVRGPGERGAKAAWEQEYACTSSLCLIAPQIDRLLPTFPASFVKSNNLMLFDLSAAFVQLIIPFLKRFCCLAPRTLHSCCSFCLPNDSFSYPFLVPLLPSGPGVPGFFPWGSLLLPPLPW